MCGAFVPGNIQLKSCESTNLIDKGIYRCKSTRDHQINLNIERNTQPMLRRRKINSFFFFVKWFLFIGILWNIFFFSFILIFFFPLVVAFCLIFIIYKIIVRFNLGECVYRWIQLMVPPNIFWNRTLSENEKQKKNPESFFLSFKMKLHLVYASQQFCVHLFWLCFVLLEDFFFFFFFEDIKKLRFSVWWTSQNSLDIGSLGPPYGDCDA